MNGYGVRREAEGFFFGGAVLIRARSYFAAFEVIGEHYATVLLKARPSAPMVVISWFVRDLDNVAIAKPDRWSRFVVTTINNEFAFLTRFGIIANELYVGDIGRSEEQF